MGANNTFLEKLLTSFLSRLSPRTAKKQTKGNLESRALERNERYAYRFTAWSFRYTAELYGRFVAPVASTATICR